MYGQQNHPEVPAKQVPIWSPSTRMSSSDDRQKWYLPKGYGTDMMLSDNQDRPNRMTNNIDSCSLRFHSSGAVCSNVTQCPKTK